MGRNLASSLSAIKQPSMLQTLASDIAALEQRVAALEARIYEQPNTNPDTPQVTKSKPRRSPKSSVSSSSPST